MLYLKDEACVEALELRSRVSESCLAVVWGSKTRGRGTGAAKPAVVVGLHLCALMVVSISNSLGSAAAMTFHKMGGIPSVRRMYPDPVQKIC